MTDAELIAAIRKIVGSKPRRTSREAQSVEARDLARYDLIVGLVLRHVPEQAATP